MAKLYVPLDGATLGTGLAESVLRGTTGRGVKTSILAAAHILEPADGDDLTGWTSRLQAGQTVDVTTHPGKAYFYDKTNAGVNGWGIFECDTAKTGDFDLYVEIDSAFLLGTNAQNQGFGIFFGNYAAPFTDGVFLYYSHSTRDVRMYANGAAGNVSVEIKHPIILHLNRATNTFTGKVKGLGDAGWTTIGNPTITPTVNKFAMTMYGVESVFGYADYNYFRFSASPYSAASPVAEAVSIACTQQIDPAGAELVQIVTVSPFGLPVVGADTDTTVKIAYAVDGGAFSAYMTLAAYKAEAAFTPSTSVEFKLQFNGDGTQCIEAYDFCAGTLSTNDPSSQSLSSYSTQSSASLSSASSMSSNSQSSRTSMSTNSVSSASSQSGVNPSSQTSASLSSASSMSSLSLSSYSSASSATSGAAPVFPAEAGVLISEGPYGPNGNDYLGTFDNVAPAAPSITASTPASGQITLTVDGDAGVTNVCEYRLAGAAAWTTGLTRSGDGNIVQTGLTNGSTYEFRIRSYNASSVYGPPSNSLFAVINTSAEVAGSAISAFMAGIRDQYINSAAFLAWIQSVDIAGATSTNIVLGYSPKDMPDVTTQGPVALIRWANLSAPNSGSSKAFRGTIDIIVDHVFAIGTHARASHTGLSDATYISKIISEMVQDVGITLDATHQGTIVNISSNDAWQEDASDARIWHREITYTVAWGVRDDGV